MAFSHYFREFVAPKRKSYAEKIANIAIKTSDHRGKKCKYVFFNYENMDYGGLHCHHLAALIGD